MTVGGQSAGGLRPAKPAGLAALVDKLLPGPGSGLDSLTLEAQQRIAKVRATAAGKKIFPVLHGNEWLGHPAHPLMVAVPIGAYVVSAWHDLRGGSSGQKAADSALLVGLTTSLPAVATGIAQFVDTSGAARRETGVHAALNNLTTVLYLSSYLVRKVGARSAGRRLSAVALATVVVSGYIGGDLAYRHGVGAEPAGDALPA